VEIDALDILSELGINYVEMYSDQRISDDINAKTNPGMSDELMEKVKARLQSRGVKVVCYGVVRRHPEVEWPEVRIIEKEIK